MKHYKWASLSSLVAVFLLACTFGTLQTDGWAGEPLCDGMVAEVSLPAALQGTAGNAIYWLQDGSKQFRLAPVSMDAGLVRLRVEGKVEAGSYVLYMKPQGADDPTVLDYCFDILSPVVNTVETAALPAASGNAITLSGLFFSKAPNVWLVYKIRPGGLDFKRRCSVDTAAYGFDDTFDHITARFPMNVTTGESSLHIRLPRLITGMVEPRILIETLNGYCVTNLNAAAGTAANSRGTLVSYSFRDSIKATEAHAYLLNTFESGSGIMRLIKRAAGALLYDNSKMSQQAYSWNLTLFSINYTTIDWNGNPILASGVVAVPGGRTSAPLLSFQHGTMLTKKEAPTLADGSEMAFAVTFSAADGYVAAIPDHTGLGQAGLLYGDSLYHPYCQWEPIAKCDADMLPAVQQLLKQAYADKKIWNRVILDGRTFLAGYSEGGYATMALQRELEQDGARYGIAEVTASAPMDGPYSLSSVMLDRLLADQPYRVPYFVPYMLVTMNTTYNIYASPGDYIAAPYDTTVVPLIDGYHDSTLVNKAMPSIVKQCMLSAVQDQLTARQGPLHAALKQNDLIELPEGPTWKPVSPTLLIHGTTDDCVMYENSTRAYAYFHDVLGASNVSLLTIKPTFLINTLQTVTINHALYAPYAAGECWKWFHQILSGPAGSD